MPSNRIHRRIVVALRRIARWSARCFPIHDPGPLAEPWRRIAAAMLDTFFLFVVSMGLVARNLDSLNSTTGSNLVTISRVIAAISWLYVLAGWSLGATPGMRLLVIRIARVNKKDSKAPGLKTGVKRLLGFWLACLPAKGGLWPILTHPTRQGWHDTIAETIVVKRGRNPAEAFAAPQRNRLAQPQSRRVFEPPGLSFQPPDLRLAWNGAAWALLACVALVVLATYPVAWTLRTRLAGAPGDSGIFYWAYWFTGFMLRHHQPITHTRYLFYPLDIPLVYSTMDWFNGFVGAVISPRIGLIATYNVLWLGSLAASMFAVYLLFSAVARSRPAALAVSPVFGLSPFFLAHGLGHANLISAEFLPLIALFTYAWLTLRKARYAVAGGIAWALAGWCDLQFLLFGALVVGCLCAAFWWTSPKAPAGERYRALLWTHIRLLAVMGACAAGGMAWLFLPQSSAGQHENRSFADRSAQVADSAWDYFQPNPLQSLTPAQRTAPEIFTYLKVEEANSAGWIVIGLAAASLLLLSRKALRSLLPWWYLIMGAAVLSFGSAMTPGSAFFSDVSNGVSAFLAFPGNGFALPWHFEGSVYAALGTLSGFIHDPLYYEPIWTPYSWIWTILPPIRPFRGTARLSLLVALGLGLLAASTLSFLLRSRRMKSGMLVPAVSLAAVTACMAASYLFLPYPTFPPAISSAVLALPAAERRIPGGRASIHPVLEIPLIDSPQASIDQTVFQQPVFDGFLSRTPRSAYSEISENPFLTLVTPGEIETQVAQPSLAQPQQQARLRSGLADLYRMGVRFVIVRRGQLPAAIAQALNKLLRGIGAVELPGGSAQVVVYRLPPSLGQLFPDSVTANAKPPPR